jgi:hypothetical protein
LFASLIGADSANSTAPLLALYMKSENRGLAC